jgi:hypothetical protein
MGVLGCLFAGSQASARTAPQTGTATGAFVPAFFTFDGITDAYQTTGSGMDNNLCGTFTFSIVAEFAFEEEDSAIKAVPGIKEELTDCTAPDGTAGEEIPLVQANTVANCSGNQYFSAGGGQLLPEPAFRHELRLLQ